MTNEKIKDILDGLNTLQEQLLSMPDDMLLDIEPRNNKSLKEGAAFIESFNESLDQFSDSVKKIEHQIKSYFQINPEEEEIESEPSDELKQQRIIGELDKTAPHSIDEAFTYKRPYGFVLEGVAVKGVKTWKSLYIGVLNILRKKDLEKFNGLANEQKFKSNRGNPQFSTSEDTMRVPYKLKNGFFIEVNLSAKSICKNIKELLEYFNIDADQLKIYLREDRDVK
jgi:hypothetical protein